MTGYLFTYPVEGGTLTPGSLSDMKGSLDG